MARKKNANTVPTGTAKVDARSFGDSRLLVTVDSDHPDWGRLDRLAGVGNVEGAIVRLRPPFGVSDDDVARMRGHYENAGAARVTVLPRPRAELLPEKTIEPKKVTGARDAVLALVEESNSKDRDALRQACEGIMAKAGL